MSLASSITEEIKQRIDIVEFIGRYTPLKRSGSTYKGLCPFHNERTPSFTVFPQQQSWRCFGACGEGGDVFTFLMKKENLDFREALQQLAKHAGVNLEEAEHDPEANQRAALYAINERATGYFQQLLLHHPAAQGARDYLQKRGIDAATAARFQLGFALEAWSGLRDYLSEKGFGLELQQQAGLIKRNEERQSTYDAFRARLIIPIRDRSARVIGFGGRVLDDSQPKYLNTSETPLFHKSQIIYGLDMAQNVIRDTKRVVIVEGYMDVIAAHQHGFANVVACMGTSLTAEQLQQLQRYTSNFVFALDADKAGQQATVRGLNQARQALARVRKPTVTSSGGVRIEERLGAHLFIAAMPEGQDPDDVVRQAPQQWQQLVEQATPLVDFYFDLVARQFDLTSARGKGEAVAELTPLIAELDDEIERQHYIQRLARTVRIDEQLILGRVQAVAKTLRATSQREGDSKARKPAVSRLGGKRPTLPGQAEPVASPATSLPVEPFPQNSYGRQPYDDVDAGDYSSEPLPELAEPAWLAPMDTPFAPVGKTVARATVAERKNLAAPVFNQEDHLVANLLRSSELLVWLAGATNMLEISPLVIADLQNVENQEIFRALKQFMSSAEPWDLELFQEKLPTLLHRRLAQLLIYGAKLPPCSDVDLREDTIRTLIRLRIDSLGAETKNIKFLQEDASRQGDLEGAKQLGAVNNQHIRELSHLQRKRHELPQLLFRRGQPTSHKIAL